MPSGPADHRAAASTSRSAGRSRRLLVGVLVLLLAGGLLLLLRQAAGSAGGAPATSATTRSPHASHSSDRDRATASLLRALGRRLESGSPAAVAALAAPGAAHAARQLADLRANVGAVGIVGLDWRLVHPGPTGVSTWLASVSLRWRTAGMDTDAGSARVSVRLRDLGARVGFVSASASRGRAAPGWLLGPVDVRRGTRWQVVVADGQPLARFAALARRAVAAVDRVLPRWRGHLVVEVPGSQTQLDRVLGERAGSRTSTAAVTTTVDGSLRPTAPVHVFVNPRVVDPLGPRASQVVLSHEATHVATRAVFSSMPAWLVEGFADYVALDHLDVSPSVPAADLLAQVRRDGPPAGLPTTSDFDAAGARAGTSYESAWLACRLIARTYGQRRLVAFYRAADLAGSTTSAFRSVLGTDERSFVQAWRQELRRLAGVP